MKSNKLKRNPSHLNEKLQVHRNKSIATRIEKFYSLPQLIIITMVMVLIVMVWCPYFQTNIDCEIKMKLHSYIPITISKKDVHILLKSAPSYALTKEEFTTSFDHSPIVVNTSLDMTLQESLLSKIDKSNSSKVAIVVMNPDSGKIIVMSGFNRENPDENPCVIASFPAASVFKIITAAAAIEKCGYSSNSIFKFNGCKHTLYKRQIVTSTNRYTNKISLRNSFAQSVNPVFGKIGSLHLGGTNLRQYGNVFGFNREISFEMPWDISNLAIEDDPYHWAEIASGFNRETTISPLHGAIIASAVVNGGIPVEPTIIEQIIDENGNPIYTSKTKFLDRAVNVDTATILSQLMTATITSGTGRKAFKDYGKNTTLRKLTIGGKTGSIYNKAHDTRFDWFVGFAKNKHGSEKIVVSVVVAHNKYIGTRAGQYARMAIENYFKKHFEQNNQT